MFKVNGRYLSRRTDFRAVFGEIFTKHFGDTPAQLETVIPGYSQAVGDYPCPDGRTGDSPIVVRAAIRGGSPGSGVARTQRSPNI